MPTEPVNVGLAKLASVEYHDSGNYMSDLARAAAPAGDWLRQRAPQVARPALVLDVDDTALTNWPVILANDFGRFPTGPCLLPEGPCGWHAWDLRGQDAPGARERTHAVIVIVLALAWGALAGAAVLGLARRVAVTAACAIARRSPAPVRGATYPSGSIAGRGSR